MQLPKLFRNEARASVAIAVPLRGSTQAPRGYEARARVSAVVGKWSLCGLKTPGRFLPTLVGVVGEGGGISRQSGSIRATLVLAIPVPSVGQAQGVGSTRGMSSCARHFLSYPVVCSVVFCSRVKSAGSSRPTPAGAGRRRNRVYCLCYVNSTRCWWMEFVRHLLAVRGWFSFSRFGISKLWDK